MQDDIAFARNAKGFAIAIWNYDMPCALEKITTETSQL